MLQTIINSHERIALEVSGGRDSLACFYLVRAAGLLDRVTVYWVNTGNAFPETLAIMEHVRSMAPHFVEIAGRQPEVIAAFGIPTDIMPRSCTPIGVMLGEGSVKMQDSYSCCARVYMQPMHERVTADGNTLIIRGQRESDSHKAPIKSGDWEHGIQYLFPIEGWSRDEVDSYLKDQGAPRNRCYDYMTSTPDCMGCSGWWDEGRSRYLRECYPASYERYQARLDLIRAATGRLIQLFNDETGGDHGE